MVKIELYSSFVFILLIGFVSAGFFSDDVVFSTSQEDYYFLVGQDASIVLNISNDLGRDVSGMITYSLTGPGINKFQSSSYVVLNGENGENIGFGSSNSPVDFDLSIKFDYGEKEVSLENIGIHFVQKEEEKQNEQNEQKSKEKKSSQKKENNQQQSQNQQSQQQSTQQKASNNQAAQNGQELKETMNRDAERAEQAKKEFMEQLQKSKELSQEHQELMNGGFEQSGGELNPEVNDSSSGDFRFNYKDKEGNEVSLNGRMENGTLTDLNKNDGRELKKLEELIREDPRFEKISEKLIDNDFSEQNVDYVENENFTEVRFDYRDEVGNEKSIVAEIENNEVSKIYLDKERTGIWMWGLLVLPVALVSYFFLKRKRKIISIDDPIKPVKKYNYRREALGLLKKSENEFSDGNFKDAYGFANQAIRLYLCYKNGLNKELTNYEILKNIDNLPKDTKNIFDLCCLVEFAKYKPNKKDFGEIIGFARVLIK
jgi:hypothetical protein